MPKSDAQRQAAYRERNFLALDGGMVRLNTALSVPAKAQLERLAARYGVTQRTVLERLIAQAERDVLNNLSATEQSRYLDALTVTQ